MDCLVEGLGKDGFIQGRVDEGVCSVPYFVWMERNGRRYDGVYNLVEHCFVLLRSEISAQSLIHTGSAISISDLLCARRLGFSGVRSRPRETFHIFWCPSEVGWVKLNTDGCSIRNPGKSGAGGVIRNDKAEMILNFRSFLGVRTNFEAEFMTLMIGIEIAIHLNMQRIWIECDSVVVVTLFLKRRPPWIARQRWQNCSSD
ncbi:uncharacterized protein LOC122093937 [Macadamia integrifolia]|uniref:uncharacterized protein LOC122093937 n=1 Tax=Macadamia integrifolia TaxID=60698 RepID=UPI001C52CF73|nr:uncharacterized protein LOC122093937 [Macadamia integrifolia]